MVQYGGKVIPLEVKAEENLQAKSLKVYQQKFNPTVALRLSMSDYRTSNCLVNLPQDASFQVRRDNQKLLSTYLVSRPFGGGIGSAGNWGQRFTPDTFLASVPADSWYVMIWAETGIVGLLLHISILVFIVAKSAWIIMAKLKNTALTIHLSALLSGMVGIMVASYGNGLLGQMPNSIIIYLSMTFIFMAPKWEREHSNINNIL